MVHRFWKAAGWLGCAVTGALFVLAFLLCSQPIWPEHFLFPGYSYAQWQALLAGPHPAGPARIHSEKYTMIKISAAPLRKLFFPGAALGFILCKGYSANFTAVP